MDKPPGDDVWRSVLEQVEAALDALNLGELSGRGSLVDEVRQALESSWEAQAKSADVTVLRGGRPSEDNVDQEERSGPTLRVVRGEAHDEPVPSPSTPDVSVRIMRPHIESGHTRQKTTSSGLNTAGMIRLDDEIMWQTLYRGQTPRTYRLHCNVGGLHVALDGEMLDEVRSGRTLDVEAQVIRVQASSQEGARGLFLRLPTS
jgi:hypothetical protein